MDVEVTRRSKLASIGALSAASLSLALYGYLSFFPEYAFHTFVSLAAIVLCSGLGAVCFLEQMRKRLVDESLPGLLEDLAECQETGMTLLQALEEASHRKYGPMTSELRKLVAKLSWGIELKEAMKSFGERLNTELTEKIVPLILEAIYMGGDLKTVFRSTAEFVKKMLDMRRERTSQLRPYLLITYTTTMTFLVIIVILHQSFFIPLSSSQNRFLSLTMSSKEFREVLFDLAVIEAFFGGLIAGKVAEGTVLAGLKHSAVLIVATLVVFAVFLV